MFQRRHYTAIAFIIASLPKDYRKEVAATFANALAHDNPNFDRTRFMTACGC